MTRRPKPKVPKVVKVVTADAATRVGYPVRCSCGHEWWIILVLPCPLQQVIRILYRSICPRCGNEDHTNIHAVVASVTPIGGRKP